MTNDNAIMNSKEINWSGLEDLKSKIENAERLFFNDCKKIMSKKDFSTMVVKYKDKMLTAKEFLEVV